ncbi:MAG: type II toxin-antitoxin system HicB family antitoxin [Lamprobacter sp.]|uniref:type II toxin-antitoxin system HicB family antitoxin n=1 Tax=Lamprobacter sp. TaxID=3100796 RepID=UPI002B258665|nr:type II toxin-antitoxin system HicB family antitoxin [Lamprobacter sp.]MEA3639484.1 type II toxin-antitoxin system HicB family antitoxin [Lamprobacter sp.]
MLTTSHSYRDYVFFIRYQATDPAYVVDFPDIPEIITSADTLGSAFGHACEALDLHLESLQKLNLPAPTRRHRFVVEAA